MPLTPADVHNVIFKKPPIGKRGYDEEDVDAFLDEVERELARLIEENADLKNLADRARSGAPSSGAGDADLRRVAAENADLKKQMEHLQQEKQRAEHAAAQAMAQAQSSVPGTAMVPSGLGDTTGEQQALRVLMMAQRTAEDHVADARREADTLLAEAREKAEKLTREARVTAEKLEQDARRQHQEVMGNLDSKRNGLQKHIEELKAFEREYRTRLKAFLESQLRDLAEPSQAIELETNAHVSASGGTLVTNGAANGSGNFTSFALDSGDSRR